MNLPPSSLLGRLEAFLPELEKANQATEKLAQEGKLEVLDGYLKVAGADQEREETEGSEAEEEEGEGGEVIEQEEGEGAASGAAPSARTVQLDFALGDFDDTPIAKMEQEKEAASGLGEESGGTVEDSGVAGLVRVVTDETETPGDAEAPSAEARPKPLIEEL